MATLRTFSKEASERIARVVRHVEREPVNPVRWRRRRHVTPSGSRSKEFWAKLTDKLVVTWGGMKIGYYSWEEVCWCDSALDWITKPGGRSGTHNAIEAQRTNTNVHAHENKVLMRRLPDCSLGSACVSIPSQSPSASTSSIPTPQYVFDKGLTNEPVASRKEL